jgi:hypothetical protein
MLALVPQQKSKKQIEKKLSDKKQAYHRTVKATQEETKLKLNEEIEHLRNSLKEFVIDTEDSANLIFDISQIAGEKKVGSFSIRAKNKHRGADIPNCNYIREAQIDISFNAGFNQFTTLLSMLERHRPVVFVDEFTITRSERGDLGHPVDMDVSVFVRKREDS